MNDLHLKEMRFPHTKTSVIQYFASSLSTRHSSQNSPIRKFAKEKKLTNLRFSHRKLPPVLQNHRLVVSADAELQRWLRWISCNSTPEWPVFANTFPFLYGTEYANYVGSPTFFGREIWFRSWEITKRRKCKYIRIAGKEQTSPYPISSGDDHQIDVQNCCPSSWGPNLIFHSPQVALFRKRLLHFKFDGPCIRVHLWSPIRSEAHGAWT